MPWVSRPFDYYGTSSTQILDDLTEANDNFEILGQAFVNNDPTTQKVKDADKVDGYHASQTPAANTIPVAGSDGKLAVGWLPSSNFIITYSNYSVSSTTPSNPARGDIYFNTSNKKLYMYNGDWEEIEWTSLIQATPEFQIGRLRIDSTTGDLEISPDGTSWYVCYPLLGSFVFKLATIDNTDYAYKYYLPPGATAIIDNANHVPIVYTPSVVPMFYFQTHWTYAYEYWVGLRPSNIAISNGYGQHAAWSGTGGGAGNITSATIVPFYEQSNTNENWGFVVLTINSAQRFLAHAMCQGSGGTYLVVAMGSGTASASSYWLGTWFNKDGVQFTANYVVIQRWR